MGVTDEVIAEMVQRLVKEFSPIRIFLFGSRAWGTPHASSDVDLMVILKSSNERTIERMQRARRAVRDLVVPKDILVKTEEEFQRYVKVYSSLEAKILERGKVLYG